MTIQEKIEQNYSDLLTELNGSPGGRTIDASKEVIAYALLIYSYLPDANFTEQEAEKLLQFENPLQMLAEMMWAVGSGSDFSDTFAYVMACGLDDMFDEYKADGNDRKEWF